jgi:uncharacterized protein (DUF58 family)
MAARELDEILREVRRVQIQARRQVNDLLAGEYASAFKGRGMEFESVREYVPGDDIRTIDWNVTARSDVPFIKTFREERESTIVIAVDISASSAFGTAIRSKLDLAIEVAAVLMFTAIRNNDKVGLLLFADDVVRYVPPCKGRGSVLRLIRELLSVEPIHKTTDIAKALQYLGRVHHRRCILFVLSDFMSHDFSRELSIANQRHDCIAFVLRDPREEILPNVGWIAFQDAETGRVVELDSSRSSVRSWYAEQARVRDEQLNEVLRRAQVERLTLRTDRPYSHDLQLFFLARERAR